LIIAVAATPSVAIPTLDALLKSEHVLDFVITQPDRPAGRGRALSESEVSVWCRENGVTCHKPESSTQTQALLTSLDVLITIGYGVILAEEVFSAPRMGSLNLHFSLLPRWRGAAPVQRAIESGDAISGVTVFALDRGMDTGPIYIQKRFALDPDITSDALLTELAQLGPEAIVESLDAMHTGVRPTPQDDSLSTRALKLSKDEAEIDWNQSAEIIERKIRAFTSNPGAWTQFRGAILKIDTPQLTQMKIPVGALRVIEKELLVGTGTLAISLGFLTPSGKGRMQALSWSHGARLTNEDHFG